MVVYKETANTNVVLHDISIARQNTAACVSLSIHTMSKTLTTASLTGRGNNYIPSSEEARMYDARPSVSTDFFSFPQTRLNGTIRRTETTKPSRIIFAGQSLEHAGIRRSRVFSPISLRLQALIDSRSRQFTPSRGNQTIL